MRGAVRNEIMVCAVQILRQDFSVMRGWPAGLVSRRWDDNRFCAGRNERPRRGKSRTGRNRIVRRPRRENGGSVKSGRLRRTAF